MSGFIEGEDRHQATLFPESLDEYIAEDSAVRVIDVFIDDLDISGLGFKTEPAETGRPGYHPKMMLKLSVYGYLNRVQSSRRLEREAQRNVELMWLTGRLAPDFKIESADRVDPGGSGDKADRLQDKIAALKEEMQRLKKLEARMLESPGQQISLTDPDARSMATSGRGSGVVGYNVQTAVDAKHHLIVAHEVTNVGNDRSQLHNMASQAKEALERRLDAEPERMRVRRTTSEHPFGTLKAWMGATHFQTRTLPRVSTEMSLHVLAYNLWRVINIMGAKPLMAAIRSP